MLRECWLRVCSDLFPVVIQNGGSDAVGITPEEVKINPYYALCCAKSPCSGYGLSPSCPPHAMKPEEFIVELQGYSCVLVFKVDAEASILMGEGRKIIARKIHDIAASVEKEALRLGAKAVKGLAAGSCKELFCDRFEMCSVLQGNGNCRFGDRSRPSLSAYGVDVGALCKLAGWKFS